MSKKKKANHSVEDEAVEEEPKEDEEEEKEEEEEERRDDESEEEYSEDDLDDNIDKEVLEISSSDSSSFNIRFGAKLPLFLKLYIDLIFRALCSNEYRSITEDCTIAQNIKKLFEIVSIGARTLETGALITVQPTRIYEPFSNNSVQNFVKRAKRNSILFGGTVANEDICAAINKPNTTFGYIVNALFYRIISNNQNEIKEYVKKHIDVFPLHLINNQ